MTTAAFDRLASRYDTICAAPVFAWMRQQVHERLRARLAAGVRVLEIGCGTGIDAAFMTQAGATVVAADPSAAMLARALERLHDEGVAGRAVLIAAGLEDLDARLGPSDPPAAFDGIFSNFGALNCAPHLAALGDLSRRRLRPGGWIVICLLNRFCAAEIVGHLLAGQPRTALRRCALSRDPVAVSVEGLPVLTTYHRPRDVLAALGPGHAVTALHGLPVIVPPPHLTAWWQRLPPPARARLERVDRALAGWWPFARMGDHYVIEVVRT